MSPVRIERLEDRLLLSDGALDTTFGGAGTGNNSFHFGHGAAVVHGFIQEADGSFLISGVVNRTDPTATLSGIAHVLADGTLDPAFGHSGKESISFDSFAAHAMALQSDGKILLAGTNAQNQFALLRLNPDGSADTSFGAAGMASATVAGANIITAMLMQSSGQIVVAGGDCLARFNADGSLDSSFGTGGTTQIGFGPLRALAFDLSGNILAAGRDGGGGVVARFTPDGMFDPSFFAFSTFAPDAQKGRFNSIFVTRTGQIIAAGQAKQPGGDLVDMAIVRFNADGSNDASFGVGGVAIESLASGEGKAIANGVVQQADNKVVIAGQAYSPAVTSSSARNQFDILRLNSDGTLDTTFGDEGIATTTFSTDIVNAKAAAVVLEPQGEVVAAGESGNDFALARYSAAFGTYDGTQLIINGTAGNDTIALSADTLAGTVSAMVNGSTETFNAANTSRIVVYGYAGNDTISVGDDVLGAELRGGPGADTLMAGNGSDTLIGGGGADSILGGSGMCSLRGGGGNDTLSAGTGDTSLRGGLGSDSLGGNTGDDLFFAVDTFPDTLIGGGGNDTASADAGIDQISGIGDVINF